MYIWNALFFWIWGPAGLKSQKKDCISYILYLLFILPTVNEMKDFVLHFIQPGTPIRRPSAFRLAKIWAAGLRPLLRFSRQSCITSNLRSFAPQIFGVFWEFELLRSSNYQKSQNLRKASLFLDFSRVFVNLRPCGPHIYKYFELDKFGRYY